MLMLGVKIDEPVHIGNGLGRVILDENRRGGAVLAFDFPKSIRINRESREIAQAEEQRYSPAVVLDGLVAQIVREDRNGHDTLVVKVYTQDVGIQDRDGNGEPVFHVDYSAHFPDRDGRLKTAEGPPPLDPDP